jgi:hypothetical protein
MRALSLSDCRGSTPLQCYSGPLDFYSTYVVATFVQETSSIKQEDDHMHIKRKEINATDMTGWMAAAEPSLFAIGHEANLQACNSLE